MTRPLPKGMVRYTLKELRPILEFYHAHFPEWRIVQRDTLVREAAPIVQGITFERLSYGAYRPIGHVRVLVAPREAWAFELPQHLNGNVCTIERRAHESKRDRVVQAIRDEFLPPVDKPLVAEEVLNLYENITARHPRSPQAYSLAAFNAYLGHYERALYWCAEFSNLVSVKLGWQDYDYRRREFLDQLERWIRAGEAKEQLERVLQEERRRWKLA